MRYLKLPALEAGEWCGKGHLMLVASFQLLVDFVEREDPQYGIEWYATEDLQLAWIEIQELYRWWTQGWSESGGPSSGADLDVEDAMFHRLINVRRYLWT